MTRRPRTYNNDPVACTVCGTIYVPKQKRSLYCSKGCHTAARRYAITCEECGKLSRVKKAAALFCSVDCRNVAKSRWNTTHGLTKTHLQEYRSWKDMRGRCNNPNDSDFKDYGGRGIRICDRWSDFAAFAADMGRKPRGYTIDRIDTNGHYEPGNCRWADAQTQANNKRNNVMLLFDGRIQTVQQWCDEFEIDRKKVDYRLKHFPLETVFLKRDFRKRQHSNPGTI